MKYNLFIALIFLVLLNSCNEISNKVDEVVHDYEFNQDISITNKIVIAVNESKQKDSGKMLTSENSFLETKDLKQLKFLDSLLNEIPKTNYCCCPYPNYSIAFYNNETKINTYYVDTIEFKNKVRIYEASFQFSFILDKKTWKHFLKEISNKN